MIELTKHCNINCNYCCLGPSRNDGKHLGIDAFRSVAMFLMQWGANYLYLTGGEPFTNPDVLKIVSFAQTLFPHVSLATNGLLVADGQIDMLSQSGLEYIAVSFDNFYNSMGCWGEDESRRIHTISRLHDVGLCVRVALPILDSDFDQMKLKRLSETLYSVGCRTLYFRFVEDRIYAKATSARFDVRSRNQIKELLSNIVCRFGLTPIFQGTENEQWGAADGGQILCPGGEHLCFVDCDANVWPCSWMAKACQANFGNINSNGCCLAFKQLLASFRSGLDRDIQFGKCPAKKYWL